MAVIREQWMDAGTSTQPADRAQAEAGVWEAFRAVDHDPPVLMFIWVDSPMAGVLASTYVGFALGASLTTRMSQSLKGIAATDVPAALSVRRTIDGPVWDVARATVHRRVEADLATRGAAWEQWKRAVGNDAWNQVWETVGDQLYSQGWEQQSRESESLFEANLAPWPNAMMDGQFSAGAMAAIDALDLLGAVDRAPFAGLQRLARSCGWWWGFEVGAVLCERPSRFDVSGEHVTIEFRDGWTVQS